jgi:hypothetical protein
MPQVVMVSATRSITWRSETRARAVPRVPRKYFWATMLVALSDQFGGELDAELLEGDRYRPSSWRSGRHGAPTRPRRRGARPAW